MARQSARPLSPHLSIWKPGIHMVVSILNRAMGVGLATAGMLALVWWLAAAASGPEAYSVFMSYATSWYAIIIPVGLSFAFYFHMAFGIRHFVMDAGAGFELNANRTFAWVSVIASVVLTGITWLIIFSKGL